MKIELDHINKFYQSGDGGNRQDVLKDISLTIQPGDVMAIVGPSGSGKSTLLNIIGTLDQPSSGSVFFNGEDISKMNDKRLAALRNQHIGFVFQLHHLLPQLTLLENVLLPVIPLKDKAMLKSARSKAMGLLDSVGLSDKIKQRPGQMSVGECQRGAVVRALINNPGLILADEPTGSLDQASAEQMGELLSRLQKEHNLAMIVVTHAESLAVRLNNVYHLVDGKLHESK